MAGPGLYPSAPMSTLIALPAFNDNYIWTLVGTGARAVLVDPGQAAPVHAAVAEHGLQPCAILLTHHHDDHIGAAAQLADDFGLPVFAPDDERIAAATHRIGEADTVALSEAGFRFEVMHLPGHTRSHLAYFGHGLALTGDTLFSLGCGRLFEGSPVQMLDSLQRLAALPPQTLICCGHEYTASNAAFAHVVEPDNTALDLRIRHVRRLREKQEATLPVSLQTELDTNPFLRCSQPAVQARVAAHIGAADLDELQTFTALRAWKDGFRPA